MPSTAALVAFAVRWTDFDPPYGGVVMRIGIRCLDNYHENCNCLKW